MRVFSRALSAANIHGQGCLNHKDQGRGFLLEVPGADGLLNISNAPLAWFPFATARGKALGRRRSRA